MKLTPPKLDGWGYRTLKISLSQLQPFLYDTPVWQTDRGIGRTDGRTGDSIQRAKHMLYAVAR